MRSSSSHEQDERNLDRELERLRLSAQDTGLQGTQSQKRESKDEPLDKIPPRHLTKTTSIGQAFITETKTLKCPGESVTEKQEAVVIVQPAQATEKVTLSKKAAPTLEKQSTSQAERNFK